MTKKQEPIDFPNFGYEERYKANRPRIRDKETWSLEEGDMSQVSKEMVTVPDESLSIDDLISRTAKGLPITVNTRSPIYHDTESFDSEDFEALQREDVVTITTKVKNTQELFEEETARAKHDIRKQKAEKAAKEDQEHIEKLRREAEKKPKD